MAISPISASTMEGVTEKEEGKQAAKMKDTAEVVDVEHPWGERKYYWTHGTCAHSSTECETRAEGHVTTATLSNKQNESTWNC